MVEMKVKIDYKKGRVNKVTILHEKLQVYWKRLRAFAGGLATEMIIIKTQNIQMVSVKSLYTDIEIEKAFNNKIVIQYHKSREKKIIIFKPENWDGMIEASTIFGNIKRGKTTENNLFLRTKYGVIYSC